LKCVSFKRAWGTTNTEIFLEAQKILADPKMLTEDSSTVLNVQLHSARSSFLLAVCLLNNLVYDLEIIVFLS